MLHKRLITNLRVELERLTRYLTHLSFSSAIPPTLSSVIRRKYSCLLLRRMSRRKLFKIQKSPILGKTTLLLLSTCSLPYALKKRMPTGVPLRSNTLTCNKHGMEANTEVIYIWRESAALPSTDFVFVPLLRNWHIYPIVTIFCKDVIRYHDWGLLPPRFMDFY